MAGYCLLIGSQARNNSMHLEKQQISTFERLWPIVIWTYIPFKYAQKLIL